VRWTETCYRPTPLQHERATVLDRYFAGAETRIIGGVETFEGAPLMGVLATRSNLASLDCVPSPGVAT
jgi:hypothetical protein